jgi:hypothetical protein
VPDGHTDSVQRAAGITGSICAVSLLLIATAAAAGGWWLAILGGLALAIAVGMMLGLRRLPVRREPRQTRSRK